jgi:hypothetical protein
VPGAVADIGQVHRVDPVLHPAGAAYVLALHPGGGRSVFLLPGLIQRPDRQAAAGPRAA